MPEDRPWLVVGLGNPGLEHARNRHNVGAMALELAAAELGGRLTRHRARARVLQSRLPPRGGRPGPAVVLAVPSTWMNLAGGPVAALASFFKVPLAQVLVLHDDLETPFGQVRVKEGGGEGGHNGLRSISQALGGRGYPRIRIGIGRPPGRQDPADFVLGNFSGAERKELDLCLHLAVDAALERVAHDASGAS